MAESEIKIIEPDTEGTGWEIVEQDGRQFARRSKSFYSRQTSSLLHHAAIPERYEEKSLENFDAYHQVLRAARSFIAGFIDRFPAVEKGLLLVGPPGTGKTHLAIAALRAAIEKAKITGLFVDYREFIRSIQDSFNPETRTSSKELVDPVLATDLLVLDELGALKPTEWVLDTITYVINNRYTNNKVTIFTTNFAVESSPRKSPGEDTTARRLNELKAIEPTLHPDEYKRRRLLITSNSEDDHSLDASLRSKIGERLMSRLYEMCEIIPFDGVADYRRR